MNFTRADNKKIIWQYWGENIDYLLSIEKMQLIHREICQDNYPEVIISLSYPPLLTGGISQKDFDNKTNLPFYLTNRGGKVTYHGTGQRVYYVLLDLRKRKSDIRLYIKSLCEWMRLSLLQLDLKSKIIDEHVGLWLENQTISSVPKLNKIAAVGVRVSKWVSYHGISININPELSHYNKFTPCGIAEKKYGVTSLANEGVDIMLLEFDKISMCTAQHVFGDIRHVFGNINKALK